jgi:hypothetical protein
MSTATVDRETMVQGRQWFGHGISDLPWIAQVGSAFPSGAQYDVRPFGGVELVSRQVPSASKMMLVSYHGDVPSGVIVTFGRPEFHAADAIKVLPSFHSIKANEPATIDEGGSSFASQNTVAGSESTVTRTSEVLTEIFIARLKTPRVSRASKRVLEFISLTPGWDGPKSVGVSPVVAFRALAQLVFVDYLLDRLGIAPVPNPKVGPTPDGEVVIEWFTPKAYLSLRCPEPPEPIYAYIELSDGAEVEVEVNTAGELAQLVTQRLL